MQYLKLNDGENFPTFGVIISNIKPKELFQMIINMTNYGLRFVDLTDLKDTESVRNAFEYIFKEHKIARNNFYITTTLQFEKNKTNSEETINSMLKSLNLTYFDAVFTKTPEIYKTSLSTALSEQDFIPLDKIPLKNTWMALEKMQKKNVIKSLGVTNYTIEALEDFKQIGTVKPAINRLAGEIFLKENIIFEYAMANKITLLSEFKMNSKFQKQEIKDIAKKYNITVAQAIIAWQTARKISTLTSTNNFEEFKEQFYATKIKLEEEDISKITTVLK